MTVEPIRDKATISKITAELKKKGSRDAMLWVMGINIGLRISDLLLLKVGQVRNKSFITITEQKTGKKKQIQFVNELLPIIAEYIQNMSDEDYLFQSRKGDNKPLSRIQAYRIINQACRNLGITDNIGSHTIRKSFGYHHYQKNKDVAILQEIFGHSSPSITLRYIGINNDIIRNSMEFIN